MPTYISLSLISSLLISVCATEAHNDAPECLTYTPIHGPAAKGVVRKIIVEMGPYDLAHKYRIMTGPYGTVLFNVGIAIDKEIDMSESAIQPADSTDPVPLFLEPGCTSSSNLLAATCLSKHRSSSKPSVINRLSRPGVANSPRSLIPISKPANTSTMELYWFKGARVDVIDEKEKVMPVPLFLCHGRIDIVPTLHNQLFSKSTEFKDERLCLFTQGCTLINLPAGFGIPISSADQFRVSMKALNPTDKHRKIKLRCTIFLVRDQDLRQPMSPLISDCANVLAIVGAPEAQAKPECTTMCEMSVSEDAPNNVVHWLEKNQEGQTLTGHWIVPPGIHTYRTTINTKKNPDFALNGPIRGAWAHVHPFCKTLSLVEVLDGKTRTVFTIHAHTTRLPTPRLKYIEFIRTSQGLALNKDASYFLEVTYNNTSGKPQDSMAITGMFFSDLKFKKPDWALATPTN